MITASTGVAPIEHGGAAFPVMPPMDTNGNIPSGFPWPEHGMTRRYWTAVHIMQSLRVGGHGEAALMVKVAYEIADELMRQEHV